MNLEAVQRPLNIYDVFVDDLIPTLNNVRGIINQYAEAENASFILKDPMFKLNTYNIRQNLLKFYNLKSTKLLKDLLLQEIINPIHHSYELCAQVYLSEMKNESTKEQVMKLYKQTEGSLILDGKMPSKWKSEQELYRIVAKHFPSAMAHATPNWLKPQHLDIFVPELHLAFEYQGSQHFKPIEIFGGDDNYQKRKELDDRKKRLCSENQIKLVEWFFDEPINKVLLSKKLASVGIHI